MPHSLCLITNAYPDFPDSNRVVFIRDLAKLLSRGGWDVSVVAPRVFSASQRHERDDTIDIRRFSSFMGDRLLVEYPRAPVFRLTGYMAAGIIAAIKCVREQKCELIHAHWVVPAGLIALIAGWICRKPVVVTAHGSDILVVAERNPLLRNCMRFVLNHVNAVTSVATHLTEKMAEMKVPQDAILTFPMSVPTESFSITGPTHTGWGNESVIFSNRSLYPIYNVELLVKAMPAILKKIPAVRVVIAGEGPEKERLTSLAGELGVAERVHFAGAIPHDEMPHYLRTACVYVSTALSDGASVSLLEAMACGTFPVVTDIPANREWIEDGKNGFLFPANDSTALAERVVESINKPDLRGRAGEVNVSVVQQRAQWNSNVAKLLALYNQILAQS